MFECAGRVEASAFAWNRRHVTGYLAPGDEITLRCNTYTATGGPLGVPVPICGGTPSDQVVG